MILCRASREAIKQIIMMSEAKSFLVYFARQCQRLKQWEFRNDKVSEEEIVKQYLSLAQKTKRIISGVIY